MVKLKRQSKESLESILDLNEKYFIRLANRYYNEDRDYYNSTVYPLLEKNNLIYQENHTLSILENTPTYQSNSINFKTRISPLGWILFGMFAFSFVIVGAILLNTYLELREIEQVSKNLNFFGFDLGEILQENRGEILKDRMKVLLSIEVVLGVLAFGCLFIKERGKLFIFLLLIGLTGCSSSNISENKEIPCDKPIITISLPVVKDYSTNEIKSLQCRVTFLLLNVLKEQSK